MMPCQGMSRNSKKEMANDKMPIVVGARPQPRNYPLVICHLSFVIGI